MIVQIRLLLAILAGFCDRLRGRRTPRWAVVRELFGPPSSPMAAKPTFHRMTQLWWRTMRFLLRGGAPRDTLEPAETIILWTKGEPDPERYVTEYIEVGRVAFINQLACPNTLGLAARLVGVVAFSLWCLVTLPATLMLRTTSAFDRIMEVARAVLVVSAVRTLAPRRVFFYSSFERYGNLVSFLLSKVSKARVIRVPSPNPLFYHYSTCVCDEFILTSPLQLTEYAKFRPNWFVSTLRLWRPPGYVTFPQVCYETTPSAVKSIGILSGGLWRREERGDLFDEDRWRQLAAEKELHLAIRDFLNDHPDVNVTVYPHPSEKAEPAVYARAQQLYGRRIGADRIQVVPADVRTHHRFCDSNVLVAFWSTSALDALYCGHKVLFAQFDMSPKSNDPSLANIHVHDRDSFRERLEEFLSISVDQYFKRNGLEAFRHDYYANGPITIKDDSFDTLTETPFAGGMHLTDWTFERGRQVA